MVPLVSAKSNKESSMSPTSMSPTNQNSPRIYLVDSISAARSRKLQASRDEKQRKHKDNLRLSRIKSASRFTETLFPAKKSKKEKQKQTPVYKRHIIPYKPGMGSQFHDTQEWMRLRYKALKAFGLRCSCCGTTNTQFHVDHIEPRSKRPDLELVLSNLQVLCMDCNIGKGNSDNIRWRQSGP